MNGIFVSLESKLKDMGIHNPIQAKASLSQWKLQVKYYQMKKIKLIHISDLHISPNEQGNQELIINKLILDIKANTNGVDAVLFTGDIAAKGNYSNENIKLIRIFIEKVSLAAGISTDRFFMCPGNHDLDTTALKNIYRPTFDALDSNDKVDNIIDSIADDEAVLFSGFKGYNKLLDELDNKNVVLKNGVFRTYKFIVDGIEVGIACINSAWRATGKASDYDNGKLIIGRKQLELATNSISECSIKLGLVHHPFSWLSNFESSEINRITNQNYDAFFHGHVHNPSIASTQSTLGSVIVNGAGCLYQSRDYYNGYTIVELNVGEKWIFNAREYYASRHCYDVATRLASNGFYEVKINNDSASEVDNNYPTEEYIEAVIESANTHLLANSVSNIAPKDIRDIFVIPPLSKIPEKQLNNKEDSNREYIEFDKLAVDDSNIIFIGDKESGKTTLLHYLCISIMSGLSNGRHRFGGYIDFSKCKKTNAGFLDSIGNFGGNSYRRAEIIKYLELGVFILAIDNIQYENMKDRRLIIDFMEKYPKNRYIFSTNESAYETLGKSDVPVSELKSSAIYIHAFTRRHSRELAKRWYGVQDSTPLEKILLLVKKLNIPRNPFILSVLLWINERNIQFLPVNQSEIIDVFIDGLLEKLNETKERSKLDSNFKRHFVRELAYEMHVSERNTWTHNELDCFTADFFKKRILVNPSSEFQKELFDKGILLNLGENICFKFDCIRSFFLSTKMEDESFLEYALMPENFIELGTEFDYFTGRKRDQSEVLEKALKITADYFEMIEEFANQNTSNCNDFKVNFSALENMYLNNLGCDEILGEQPTNEEREVILDQIDDANLSRTNHKSSSSNLASAESMDSIGKKFITCLITVSTILRNSELIEDASLKSSAYGKIIDYWAHVLIGTITSVDNLSQNKKDEFKAVFKGLPVEMLDYLVKMLIPNAVFSMIYESMGTAKLQLVIDEHNKLAADNYLHNLLHTMLYVDLTLPDYIEKISDCIKKAPSKYYLELIFMKLVHIYTFKSQNTSDAAKIRMLAANIYIQFNGDGTNFQKNIQKDQFIKNLEKTFR